METNFDVTLSRIAEAFQVNDISTYELVTCTKNENPLSVIEKHQEFDQIPMQDGDQIVGVIERIQGQKDVSFQMHALDEGILVSADESLINFLPLLAKPPFYRLVLKGTNIKGIVTKSDALKLPVRLYSFALITQLELQMIEKIKDTSGNSPDWWDYLSQGRQDKINRKSEIFKKDKLDPSFIELTDFSDKRTILKKRYHLREDFETDVKQIEKLRDKLAHAAKYIENNQDLLDLIDTLKKCKFWITNISSL